MKGGYWCHRVAVMQVLVVIACAQGVAGEALAEVADAGFAREEICLAGGDEMHRLEVELAVSEHQRTLGLMGRDRLAPDTGMLFVYDRPRPAGSGFWMYRTRIPLDIAYLDEQGVIVSIRHMAPCESRDPRQCPAYSAGQAYRAALEVNAGYFAEHDISAGARVYRAGDPECPHDDETQ